MGSEVGGGIGLGKTCEPKAFSFQCMTKFTTNKNKKKNKKIKKKKKRQASFTRDTVMPWKQCCPQIQKFCVPIHEWPCSLSLTCRFTSLNLSSCSIKLSLRESSGSSLQPRKYFDITVRRAIGARGLT